MKVSVKKIGELAGVSPATVSNALNGKRGVNPDTAQKVIRIARELGYLKEEIGNKIRVVTYRSDGKVFSDTPFFSVLLESIENSCREAGYEMTMINLYRDDPAYSERVADILHDTSSGVLLIGTELDEEHAMDFYEPPVPLVILDANFSMLSFHTVLMDNISGAVQSMDLLLKDGHRKIGYLAGESRIQNFKFREKGFKLALAEYGMAFEDKYIFSLPTSIQDVFREMRKYIQAGREMPTAFVADNDMIALGAMQALQAEGYKVPEDVSIIGFDDIPFSSVFAPGLTTIHVHNKEMGRVAVSRLLDLIAKPEQLPARIEIANEIVVRGSVHSLV